MRINHTCPSGRRVCCLSILNNLSNVPFPSQIGFNFPQAILLLIELLVSIIRLLGVVDGAIGQKKDHSKGLFTG
jgi:hypothetical protein